MFFLFSVAQVWAQNRTVTGKVTDEKGAAIAGATVVANGLNKGITKQDGTFSISIPTNVKNLTFKGVGFTHEEKIPAVGSMTVKVAAAGDALDEVVVQVPYGTIKKTNSTGSVSQVTSKQIANQQVTSVTNALEGLVTGIITTNGGGQPGNSNASIRIRGFGSLNGSNDPLYILNGVPYTGDISLISTDDIESVDVMKDAAASALYGARAANGVIMITTKKGKKGALKAGLNVRQGYSNQLIANYDRLNQKQYYETAWEALRNQKRYNTDPSQTAVDERIHANSAASLQLIDILGYNAYNVSKDALVDSNTGKLNPNAKLLWNDKFEDYLFRQASRTNLNFNVSGATDKSNFFLSAGYLDEKGIVISSDFKRYTLRLSAEATPTSWLTTGLNIDGAYVNQNYTYEGGAIGNAFTFSREIAPIYPVFARDVNTGALLYDKKGNTAYDFGTPNLVNPNAIGMKIGRPYLLGDNAVGTLMLDKNYAEYINANANVFAEIKFSKNIALKTTVGTNIYDEGDKSYDNNTYGANAIYHGRTTVSNVRRMSVTANQVLSWSKSFTNNNFRVLAGHESYLFNNTYSSVQGKNNAYDEFNDISNDSTIDGSLIGYKDMHRIESYFGGINYDYDGKYLATFSVRRDGTSRFRTNRWGNFYSGSVGWRISQESFLKNVKWINDLKLKVGFGQQGNEDLGGRLNYYIDREWYEANHQGSYSDPSRKENADLKWETSQALNIGVDFSLFKRRLQGTIEFFDRYTKDMLFDVSLPGSSGYLNQYQNGGKLRNYGVELSLGYNAVKTKNFDWRVDLNISTVKNVLVEILSRYDKTGGFNSGNKRIAVGHSIYDFYMKEFAGVDPLTGLGLYYKDITDPITGKATGKRDLTDDPSNATNYFTGQSSIPKFNGGLQNSFKYKNYELSINTTFSYGGTFYDGNYASLMGIGTAGTNWHTDISKRWQKPGDITNVPRIQYNSKYGATSSRFLFDASYINIKNVTFSYTLPKISTNNIGIERMVLNISVDNAFLFTAKKGSNPQAGFSGGSSVGYPPFRTVSFGLNCNF
jgi:TonB-linked SusC/RagA family outer membrane protein